MPSAIAKIGVPTAPRMSVPKWGERGTLLKIRLAAKEPLIVPLTGRVKGSFQFCTLLTVARIFLWRRGLFVFYQELP